MYQEPLLWMGSQHKRASTMVRQSDHGGNPQDRTAERVFRREATGIKWRRNHSNYYFQFKLAMTP
nr:hypothetical protein [Dendronalium sp. ChiSLP03b]